MIDSRAKYADGMAAPIHEISWPDTELTPVRLEGPRAPDSHVRVRSPCSQLPLSLPKLAPVLELPPALDDSRGLPAPAGFRETASRETQALPLVRRAPEREDWMAASAAMPLLCKLELDLLARRARARLAWRVALLGAVLAAIAGGAGFWQARSATALAAALFQPGALASQAAARGYAVLELDGPEGARVELDGEAVGALPLKLDALAPGSHRLRIDGRPQAGVLVRELEIAGGEHLRLDDLAL
jgi:hypothetical protein